MSASSRLASRPADQVASSLEPGRKLILQVVCAGYLIYLLLHRLLLPGELLPPLGPTLIGGYVGTGTLILTLLPTIRFRPLSLLLALTFLPYTAFNLLLSLRNQLLPLEDLIWMPLVVVVSYCVLGWRLGALLIGLLTVVLLIGLWLFHAGGPQAHGAWTALGMMLVILSLICSLVSRFVEERLLIGQEASQQLEAARMDALTGVMGRAAAEAYLHKGLERSQQDRLPLSFLICDLDNFKAVNDRYGHPVGDAVLKAAARRLRRQTGDAGRVGRWGGEEFVVILPSMSKPEALVLAERMRRSIAGNDLAGLSITASFGVASYRAGDSLAELFERADQRLYEAKHSGRNAVRG